jgi:hypothetical protein
MRSVITAGKRDTNQAIVGRKRRTRAKDLVDGSLKMVIRATPAMNDSEPKLKFLPTVNAFLSDFFSKKAMPSPE